MLTCFIVIFINLLRGAGGISIIGEKKCSDNYWITTSMVAVDVIIFVIIGFYTLRNLEKLKVKLNYKFIP